MAWRGKEALVRAPGMDPVDAAHRSAGRQVRQCVGEADIAAHNRDGEAAFYPRDRDATTLGGFSCVADAGPVLGLKHVNTFEIVGLPPVLIYQNTGGLPEVVLADPALKSFKPPEMDDCKHEGLLCRDFRSTLTLVDDVPGLRAQRQSDRVEVTFPATTEPRVALLRDMYRPEWRATAHARDGVPRQLRTFEVLGGVVGVDVPVGTSRLTIWFDPAGRGVALRITLLTALLSLGLIGAAIAVDRWRQERSAIDSRRMEHEVGARRGHNQKREAAFGVTRSTPLRGVDADQP